MEPSSHKDISNPINPDQEEDHSTMVLVRRVLIPKEEEDGNSPPLNSIQEDGNSPLLRSIQEDGNSPLLRSILPIRTNKRRCVSSACIPCRKRKSKVSDQSDLEIPIRKSYLHPTLAVAVAVTVAKQSKVYNSYLNSAMVFHRPVLLALLSTIPTARTISMGITDAREH